MLDWRYWFSVTLSLTYNYICRSVTHILWLQQCFCLIFSILSDEQASFFGYWFWYGLLIYFSWLSDFESFTYFCLYWCFEVWYENICECSKVKNRQVIYSRHKAGASVYFRHISSFFRVVVPNLVHWNENLRLQLCALHWKSIMNFNEGQWLWQTDPRRQFRYSPVN